MSTILNFDKRAAEVKAGLIAFEGKAPEVDVEGKISRSRIAEYTLVDMKEAVKQVNQLRSGSPINNQRALDVSFCAFIKQKWGYADMASLYDTLGINPGGTTIEQLMTMPETPEGYRWLVPEVIREAIRLGLRRNPIYPSLIAAEESVTQPTVIMPSVNLSDAMPTKINEAETIPVGTVDFGQKTVKLNKYGVGIKVTDEVLQYVSLNLISVFFQDAGVKMNLALDTKAILTLINGDQPDGSDSCAVIGVNNTGDGFKYRDMLRAWIRLSRIGRLPSGILSNESPALDILELPEFKGFPGDTTKQRLIVKTPIPASQDYWIHGAMPATNQIMLVDGSSALIKLNAQALRVESDRIVERQINGTYATMTTGFATLFRDARLLIDKSVAFSDAGFPSWMDAGAFENQNFKNE